MTMIEALNMQNLDDVNKPNQSFNIIGKIIPVFHDGAWSYTEYLFEKPYEKHYSAENLKYENYIDNPEQIIYLYYDDKKCVGQIELKNNWNKFAMIRDIAVSQANRGKGVGSALIQKAIEWAKQNSLKGLMLETQDTNLLACRFYHKIGFQIGGVDTMLYSNFDNADEIAVFWYMKF